MVALGNLPIESRIIATGNNLDEIRRDGHLYNEGNVLLNITGSKQVLAEIVNEMPFLVWIHSITAGVDHILCPEIVDNNDILLTNAKGVFSSSLAEYVMTACSYFAKDIPRLLHQQKECVWEKFCVRELRGATMGIVGYGNIGKACAKLAKVYGMKILALRRNPEESRSDPDVDQVYGIDDLNTVLSRSDYLVVAMPLTSETHHMLNESNLQYCKLGQVLINIGRGPLIDEAALIAALSDRLQGAALDVFAVEPLPSDSPLWGLPNVLISPHNADLTETSRYSSVLQFTENCRTVINGDALSCVVDKKAGY